MRTSLLLLTFSFVLFASSVVSADWHYDFNGPNWEPPEDFNYGNNTRPWSPEPSDTFELQFENDYVRLSDPRGWGDGGASTGFVGNTEEFTDVRVSATFNPSLDSNKRVASVGARGGDHGNYTTWIWQSQDTATGYLGMTKTLGNGSEQWEFFDPATFDPAREWLLVLEVVDRTDDSQTDYVDVTGMLIDPGTGETQLTLNRRDYADPFRLSGTSFAGVSRADSHAADSQYPMNTTFDNISSVTIPEPTTAVLIVLGLCGVLALRKRK